MENKSSYSLRTKLFALCLTLLMVTNVVIIVDYVNEHRAESNGETGSEESATAPDNKTSDAAEEPADEKLPEILMDAMRYFRIAGDDAWKELEATKPKEVVDVMRRYYALAEKQWKREEALPEHVIEGMRLLLAKGKEYWEEPLEDDLAKPEFDWQERFKKVLREELEISIQALLKNPKLTDELRRKLEALKTQNLEKFHDYLCLSLVEHPPFGITELYYAGVDFDDIEQIYPILYRVSKARFRAVLYEDSQKYGDNAAYSTRYKSLELPDRLMDFLALWYVDVADRVAGMNEEDALKAVLDPRGQPNNIALTLLPSHIQGTLVYMTKAWNLLGDRRHRRKRKR